MSQVLGRARYISFLGRRLVSLTAFLATGNWKCSTPIPEQSWEFRERRLEGEDRTLLLDFLRSIFTWLPEQRPPAADLARHAFLMQPYFALQREKEASPDE
jgi:hypothetical protein